MRRRSLLVGLSAAVGAIAGCNTIEDEATDPADASGPTIDSEFSGLSVPELPSESEVTWYHESDETTRGFVRPSTETAELPARVEFTYHNRSEESTGCSHWNLYKLRGDRWFHIGPSAHDGVCFNISAGESETWTMAAAATTGEVDDGDRAILTLERAQTADRAIIAEQVMRRRNRGYRNLLVFVDEAVERVVLRTDERTADWIVDDAETTRFRYGDQAYRVTRASRDGGRSGLAHRSRPSSR
ncbi:hypothetical protein [Halorubrum amylolyticum]|uniref:hypothetical protein n=1 Tax=Halorubrum amylolyticum TaxID=2508724 RepID=UPI001008C2E9|nr:hypothetical protein [Halorubrum amylolyticum]